MNLIGIGPYFLHYFLQVGHEAEAEVVGPEGSVPILSRVRPYFIQAAGIVRFWLLLEMHIIVKLQAPLWRIGLCWEATRAPQWSRGMGDVLMASPSPVTMLLA